MSKKKTPKGSPFEKLRALKDELKKKEGQPPAPTRPVQAPPKREEPEDEALTFHRLFAGVEPLDRSRGARLPRQRVERSAEAERAAKRGEEAARAEAESVSERLRELVEGGGRFEVNDDGKRVEGRRTDVPPDLMRRLRRGLLPVDARIDLHGMSAAEARGQLELFLRTMRARGQRCVLVVHGKGVHSPRGIGVLRGEIAAWLSQSSMSAQVAGFATAHEDDGGEGAVYVLLRRA